MQLATCDVMIGTFGDTVPRTNVTPAEVQFLIHEHMATVKKLPILNLVVTEEVAKHETRDPDTDKIISVRQRTAVDEKQRLKMVYDSTPVAAKNRIEQMFPGQSPNMPMRFVEVVDTEGNHPFDGKGVAASPVTPTSEVQIGGKVYSQNELAQLVAAGESALKVQRPVATVVSGSKNDQDEEE